jgi:SAM-dependent methyltransferase
MQHADATREAINDDVTITTRSLPTSAGKDLHACRLCGAELKQLVTDLGMQPLCESYISSESLDAMEPFYPLKAYVCGNCYLVQVLDFVSGEHIYSHYAYFSSYSDSWLRHIQEYVAKAIDRFDLTSASQVVELASNDGYLLQYMAERNIPVLGVEPAANVAKTAIDKGIPTVVEFFGVDAAVKLLEQGMRADLLIGNNVLAHVPDLNDFIAGIKLLLADEGVVTIEVPSLDSMFRNNQFDTIYQEHYTYFSFVSITRAFEKHGLIVFDVEKIWTHGGSMRVYARHKHDHSKHVTKAVTDMLSDEIAAGYDDLATYQQFGEQVKETKRKLLSFLIEAKSKGATIAAYGAPGKGNTLLNYCGIREDFIDYTVDRNPFKHGKYLPGTRIPIFTPAKLAETKPDYILILPWNIRDELLEQLDYARDWGAKFIIPIPEVEVL